MREAKYRGLNGETGWHYGIPITNKKGTFISFEKNPHICDQYHYIEIDEFEVVRPETVSEVVHIDRNGKEIFRGDIVSVMDCEPSLYEVVYWENNFKYGIEYIGNDKTNWQEEALEEFSSEDLEVVGNKWENPELYAKENACT